MANNDTISFDVDTSELTAMFSEFEEISTKKLEEIFRQEFVLLIVELVKLTPPAKRGTSVKKIDADLKTLFRASQKMEFRDKYLQKLKKQGGQKLAEVLTKIDSQNRKFISEQPSKSRHNRNRDKRGRVVRDPRYQIVTSAGDFNKFKKQKVSNIGKAKAGWIPKRGIQQVGKKNFPGWLDKHKSGKYTFRRNEDSITMSIENSVNYIVQLDVSFNIVKRALANRKIKTMIKMKRALKTEVRKMNRKK